MTQRVLQTVNELLLNIRVLRAGFEELALQVRNTLQTKGIPAVQVEAELDLRYQGDDTQLTVRFPLEAESAEVCLADPLPLDQQALRWAHKEFQRAYTETCGPLQQGGLHDRDVEVVRLRVRGTEAD